jgi:hypothetical protein
MGYQGREAEWATLNFGIVCRGILEVAVFPAACSVRGRAQCRFVRRMCVSVCGGAHRT